MAATATFAPAAYIHDPVANAQTAAGPNTATHGLRPAGTDLVSDLRMVQNAERLLAWAGQLTHTYTQWVQERDAFLSGHQARALEAQKEHAAMQAWLAPLPSLLHATHDKHMQALGGSLADAKRALHQRKEAANQDCEYLEEAMLRRQRLARCRLARREERVQAQAARLARATEQRVQDERARLERERARAAQRRADLELERMRLQAALDKDRALFRPPRTEVATQTALTGAAGAAAAGVAARPAAPESSDESYSSDTYSDDDFGSISGESEEEQSEVDASEGTSEDVAARPGPAASGTSEFSSSISSSIHSDISSFSRRTSSSARIPRAINQAPRSEQASSGEHESFSGGSSETSHTPADRNVRRSAAVAAESMASIESFVSEDIAGSIASSIQSIGSA